MEPEDQEKLLKQYATLTRKLANAERELDKLHELVRVEGVYTYSSSNKAIWSEIHEKRRELAEFNRDLNRILDHILTRIETNKR